MPYTVIRPRTITPTRESEHTVALDTKKKTLAEKIDEAERSAPEIAAHMRTGAKLILKKGLNPDLNKAAVVATFDDSGSAEHLYLDGSIQESADLVLAAGLIFDDDGSVPVSFFSHNVQDLGEITLSNARGFISRQRPRYRGTSYSSALEWVKEQAGFGGGRGGIFGRSKQPSIPTDYPTFAIVVTDGEPQDPREAERALIEMSRLPIFVQFIGVGPHRFEFLKKLDDLPGRFIDNAGFYDAKEARGDVDAMLAGLLNEFPDYVNKAKQAGLIR